MVNCGIGLVVLERGLFCNWWSQAISVKAIVDSDRVKRSCISPTLKRVNREKVRLYRRADSPLATQKKWKTSLANIVLETIFSFFSSFFIFSFLWVRASPFCFLSLWWFFLFFFLALLIVLLEPDCNVGQPVSPVSSRQIGIFAGRQVKVCTQK